MREQIHNGDATLLPLVTALDDSVERRLRQNEQCQGAHVEEPRRDRRWLHFRFLFTCNPPLVDEQNHTRGDSFQTRHQRYRHTVQVMFRSKSSEAQLLMMQERQRRSRGPH